MITALQFMGFREKYDASIVEKLRKASGWPQLSADSTMRPGEQETGTGDYARCVYVHSVKATANLLLTSAKLPPWSQKNPVFKSLLLFQ